MSKLERLKERVGHEQYPRYSTGSDNANDESDVIASEHRSMDSWRIGSLSMPLSAVLPKVAQDPGRTFKNPLPDGCRPRFWASVSVVLK